MTGAGHSVDIGEGLSIFATPLEHSSEHFRFVADTYTSSEEEIQEGIEKGEALYAAMAAIIPALIPLNSVIEVRLNGNVRKQTPYVDDHGTVQLYRFSDEEGGYWALFAHELVHAIALDYQVEVGSYGRQAVMDIAYSTQEMTPEYIQSVLGEPLTVVDANWRDWVLARYADHPAADQEAAQYRQRNSVYQACE